MRTKKEKERAKAFVVVIIATVCCGSYLIQIQEEPPVPAALQSLTPSAGLPVDDSAAGTLIKEVGHQTKIQWVSLLEAKKGSLPIWVHFTAKGKGNILCEQLALETSMDSGIVEMSKHFSCVLEELDGLVAKKWEVQNAPYDFFITEKWETEFRGDSPATDFAYFLAERVAQFQKER